MFLCFPLHQVNAGYDPVSNCYRIKTLDSYHAYDQVFIHYGPHDNVNLLLEYGFVIPSNPHDAVSFELGEPLIELTFGQRGGFGVFNAGSSSKAVFEP